MKIVVLWECRRLAAQARRKARMIQVHVPGTRIESIRHFDLRKASTLEIPGTATQAASEADIIFAGIDSPQLSSPAKRWFWHLAKARRRVLKKCALVCLLGPHAQGWNGALLREFFESVAAQGRMHLLCHTFDVEEASDSSSDWKVLDRA